VSIDLPGHGNSLPLDSNDDLSMLARKIGALAIAQGVRHVVSLSFGAVVALQVVLEYPKAFATLTLAAPLLGGGPFDSEIWRRYHKLKALFAQTGHGPNLGDHWMDATMFRGIEECPELHQQLRRQVRRHPWWELNNDSYVKLWHTPQSIKDLRTIALPTRLLVGGADCDPVKQSASLLEQVIQRCQRSDFPDLGHLSLLAAPQLLQPIFEHHWFAASSRELDVKET
jgi:pimeloyl-ACP methyl ester carboxylesterase